MVPPLKWASRYLPPRVLVKISFREKTSGNHVYKRYRWEWLSSTPLRIKTLGFYLPTQLSLLVLLVPRGPRLQAKKTQQSSP